MGRHKKQGLDYFRHYSKTQGKTMDTLQAEYGNDGYAFWFKLLEILGQQNELFYDCSNIANWRYFVSNARISQEKALEIMELLCDLEAVDAELWRENRIIWVQNLVDNAEDLYNKRNAPKPQKPDFRHRNNTSPVISVTEMQADDELDGVSVTESTQSKVKQSKVKQSKVKQSKEFAAQCADPEKYLVPKNRRKLELTQDQLILFNAGKLCFESSPRAKAMIFKDSNTAAMNMRKLKEIAVACTNIEPEYSAAFLRAVLEHFRVMVNGKLKGKAEFTPRALAIPWIWESVIGSLPDNDGITEELRQKIKGLFK
jgi:hypothetical protein